MYNWVVTRKIPRTEGPTYPARAAQTVDAVVRTWIPASAALLACFVTPARATLDARYYESPNYPVRAVQTVDTTVRTWQPADTTELASFSTPARPSLDVRRYEWAPESFDLVTRVDLQVRTWQPAVRAELDSTRTPARTPLEVREYDWAPAFSWVRPVADATVRTWAPAFSTELASFSTPARAPLDVRRYDWSPEPAWIQSEADAVIQTWLPAATSELASFRTPAAPSLDVRAYDWSAQASPWIAGAVDAVVQTWVAPTTTELAAIRTTAAPRLDVRGYDWAPSLTLTAALTPQPGGGGEPNGKAGADYVVRRVIERTTGPQDLSWFTSLPVTLTTAQTAPAWTSQAQSFRTASGPTVDVFRAQSIPDIFGVPDDWITWVPIQDDGGRTRDRARLDVRAYEWSQSGWITATLPIPSTVAQQWPALLEAAGLSYRTLARPGLDVRGYEWASGPAWITVTLPPVATQAQVWPAIAQGTDQQFRTRSGATLDVRLYEWRGDSPVATLLQATVRTWAPVFATELASTRTGDRPRLDVRLVAWAPPPAWIDTNLPIGPFIPAILEDLTTLWTQTYQPALHAADAVGGSASDDTTLLRHDIDAHGTAFDREDDLNTSLQKYFDTDF